MILPLPPPLLFPHSLQRHGNGSPAKHPVHITLRIFRLLQIPMHRSHLRRIFMEAIENPDVAILSIATRPDCLSDEVLDLLLELNQIKPVWIELGLQTIHPETLAFIRSGFALSDFDRAVTELHKRGHQSHCPSDPWSSGRNKGDDARFRFLCCRASCFWNETTAFAYFKRDRPSYLLRKPSV